MIFKQNPLKQSLTGLPLIKTTGFMLNQKCQFIIAIVKLQVHGCRKIAQQGYNWLLGDLCEFNSGRILIK